MTEGVFPSVLHEDPRYFKLTQGGFFQRTRYAISRIFVTRTDAGRTQFNYSEIAGNAMAAGISNLYYPAENRTAPNALAKWGTGVAVDTFYNLMWEFWPDIRRKFSRK